MTPPMNIKVTRINDTTVRVTWGPLTLIEARGFITNYTIIIQPQGKRADGSIVTTVPHNVSSTVITGLDPGTNYVVTITVGTSVGQLSSPSLEIPGNHNYSTNHINAMIIFKLELRQPASASKSASTSTASMLQSNLLPTAREEGIISSMHTTKYKEIQSDK